MKGVFLLKWGMLLVLLVFSFNTVAFEIIANDSVVSNEITKMELRAVFGLKLTRWTEGEKITVIAFNGNSDLHSGFCKHILSVFPHQLQSTWDLVKYSGKGQIPIVVSNENEMIDFIKNTPGSIGYLPDRDKEKIKDEKIEGYKILEIVEGTNGR